MNFLPLWSLLLSRINEVSVEVAMNDKCHNLLTYWQDRRRPYNQVKYMKPSAPRVFGKCFIMSFQCHDENGDYRFFLEKSTEKEGKKKCYFLCRTMKTHWYQALSRSATNKVICIKIENLSELENIFSHQNSNAIKISSIIALIIDLVKQRE